MLTYRPYLKLIMKILSGRTDYSKKGNDMRLKRTSNNIFEMYNSPKKGNNNHKIKIFRYLTIGDFKLAMTLIYLILHIFQISTYPISLTLKESVFNTKYDSS